MEDYIMEDYIGNILNFDDYPLTIYSKEEEADEVLDIHPIKEKEFLRNFDIECQDILTI